MKITARTSAARIGVLSGVMLALGCGSKGSTDLFVGDSGAPSDSGDDASAGLAASGPAEQFTSSDAGPSGATFDCKPGTYAGTFATHVTSDAGGLFAFVSFDFKGTLSIVIVGHVVQQAGELPQTTYSIAPGAKVNGTDQSFGGSYHADLTGQLDCATRVFSGTLNGAYDIFSLDASSIALQGTLTGMYVDAEGGAPALTGTMSLSSSQVASLAADGPWTATLQ
jgi:hypothetical protein